MKRTELVLFIVVMAIALVIRFYGLTSAPPGLSPDEGVNGTNALSTLQSGDYRFFYPEADGREGLFINLQAIAVRAFGNTTFALRFVSALAGVLTVLGTYLLARRMFDDWRLAALAAFLIAIGSWHVTFSRIGLGGIMAPLAAVWGFYYLYKGIETHRLWHWAVAGVWFGLGFHTYIAFRILPLAVALTLGAFWLSLAAVFSHEKYRHARHQMLGGAALMVSLMILVLLPMAAYFYANPHDFTGARADSAVWTSSEPFASLVSNAGKTLGMFFFVGDSDWNHAIADEPILFWPVAAFFAVGLLHTLWRFFHSWRMRGHPGVVQTLLLSWLFIGLIPSFLTSEGTPDAMRALVVAPAVYLIAAAGLHWLYLSVERWYGHDDVRTICLPMRNLPGSWGRRVCVDRSTFVVGIALICVLLAAGIGDVRRYFVVWAQSPGVAAVFPSESAGLAVRLSALPPAALKYVYTGDSDLLIRGFPLSAQPLMFLTDTWHADQQRANNIYYLTSEQFVRHEYPRAALVFRLTTIK